MRSKGFSKTAYRQLWQNHVNDWRASGLTKKQYAQQHQLNDWQLVDWIRRLATVQTTPPAIIPVHIVQPSIVNQHLKMIIKTALNIKR